MSRGVAVHPERCNQSQGKNLFGNATRIESLRYSGCDSIAFDLCNIFVRVLLSRSDISWIELQFNSETSEDLAVKQRIESIGIYLCQCVAFDLRSYSLLEVNSI